MAHWSRRRFLQASAAAPLAAAVGCAVPGGGDRPIRVALAGVRMQGRRLLAGLLRHTDVDLVALADPDSALLMQAAGLAARFGRSPAIHQDPRPLLEDPGVEVLVIATPDHWHGWLTVRACTAGKHVFVETPAAHGIEEGAAMVAAARRHDRQVGVSLRSRSARAVQDAMRFVQQGGIGRVQSVRCVCYLRRHSIGRTEVPSEIPPHIDYDLWSGPATREPLRRRSLHGDWRFDWRTGSGELGEAGSELLDLARWAVADAATTRWPEGIWTCGGRIGTHDDGQTPNTLVAVLRFGGVPVVFDQRNLPVGYEGGSRMDRYRGLQYGVAVEGEGRSLFIEPGRKGCAVYDDERKLVRTFTGGGDALRDFLDAVRRGGRPAADIEVGRAASDLGQLIAACHRTAPRATRLEALRQCAAEPTLVAEFDGLDSHIGRNGFDLDQERPRVSRWQPLDPATGEFRDRFEANALRVRSYRAPFLLHPGRDGQSRVGQSAGPGGSG